MTLFKLPPGEFTRALGGLGRVFKHVGLVSLVINLLLLALRQTLARRGIVCQVQPYTQGSSTTAMRQQLAPAGR